MFWVWFLFLGFVLFSLFVLFFVGQDFYSAPPCKIQTPPALSTWVVLPRSLESSVLQSNNRATQALLKLGHMSKFLA